MKVNRQSDKWTKAVGGSEGVLMFDDRESTHFSFSRVRCLHRPDLETARPCERQLYGRAPYLPPACLTSDDNSENTEPWEGSVLLLASCLSLSDVTPGGCAVAYPTLYRSELLDKAFSFQQLNSRQFGKGM